MRPRLLQRYVRDGCDGQAAPCGVIGDADFNGDTIVDVLDFLDFLDAFGVGC